MSYEPLFNLSQYLIDSIVESLKKGDIIEVQEILLAENVDDEDAADFIAWLKKENDIR